VLNTFGSGLLSISESTSSFFLHPRRSSVFRLMAGEIVGETSMTAVTRARQQLDVVTMPPRFGDRRFYG